MDSQWDQQQERRPSSPCLAQLLAAHDWAACAKVPFPPDDEVDEFMSDLTIPPEAPPGAAEALQSLIDGIRAVQAYNRSVDLVHRKGKAKAEAPAMPSPFNDGCHLIDLSVDPTHDNLSFAPYTPVVAQSQTQGHGSHHSHHSHHSHQSAHMAAGPSHSHSHSPVPVPSPTRGVPSHQMFRAPVPPPLHHAQTVHFAPQLVQTSPPSRPQQAARSASAPTSPSDGGGGSSSSSSMNILQGRSFKAHISTPTTPTARNYYLNAAPATPKSNNNPFAFTRITGTPTFTTPTPPFHHAGQHSNPFRQERERHQRANMTLPRQHQVQSPTPAPAPAFSLRGVGRQGHHVRLREEHDASAPAAADDQVDIAVDDDADIANVVRQMQALTWK